MGMLIALFLFFCLNRMCSAVCVGPAWALGGVRLVAVRSYGRKGMDFHPGPSRQPVLGIVQRVWKSVLILVKLSSQNTS